METPAAPDSSYAEALTRFHELLERAKQSTLREPATMSLATADERGRPSVRAVLLKGMDARGCVFYTNLESRKAQQLAANPRAALGFFWDPLEEQVLIEGEVHQVSNAEADAYWATRDLESQIGAWASLQSRILENRKALEARIADYNAKFAGRPVPRPPHWSGFRLAPERIEFWKARPFRLNERTLYQKKPTGQWTSTLLYP